MKYALLMLLFNSLVCFSADVWAKQDPSTELIAAQKSELLTLKEMDGVWRGNAWTMLPDGTRLEMVQTERVGTMLDGAVKVVEGRGYDSDGEVVFNAFASMAYDPVKKHISMHSYARGRVGTFVVKPTDEGYSWEIPAGPATIRYVAKITDGTWFEYGERIIPNREPFRFFEMELTRLGDTTWPAGDPIPMRATGEGQTKQ